MVKNFEKLGTKEGHLFRGINSVGWQDFVDVAGIGPLRDTAAFLLRADRIGDLTGAAQDFLRGALARASTLR